MQPYGLERRFFDWNEVSKGEWSRKTHDRQYRRLGRRRARREWRRQVNEEMEHTPGWGSSDGRAPAL